MTTKWLHIGVGHGSVGAERALVASGFKRSRQALLGPTELKVLVREDTDDRACVEKVLRQTNGKDPWINPVAGTPTHTLPATAKAGRRQADMARKPANFQWLGFTDDQLGDLDFLDHLGNNGWARNSQSDAIMPEFIVELDESIGLERVKQCMAEIGYGRSALQMLDRWHSKGTTGKFGR